MSGTRVYVPTSWSGLKAIVLADGLGPAPFFAHAVTDELRAAYPEGDEEEWEYAALMAASDDSAGMLGEDDPPRRVVLAVDVEAVTEREDSSLVEVDSAFGFALVRAVHADTEDIRGAAYDPDEHGDLGWYAVQEIPDLLLE